LDMGKMTDIPPAIQKTLSEDFDIAAIGPFEQHQITVHYEKKQFPFSQSMLDSIEAEWKSQTAKYPGMFNGPLYHLEKFEVINSQLRLYLSDTTYKEYVGTRSEKYHVDFGIENAVNPLSVGMVLVTIDRKCIVGIRGGAVDSFHGKIATVAGYMERDRDITDDVPNPFVTVKNELQEETGVKASAIDKSVCLGLFGRLQTLSAFRVDLKIDTKEFRRKSPTDIEFTEFLYVDLVENVLESFILDNRERIAPYCLANLILLGRDEFSDNWINSIIS
jgi:hypothetical protein